MTEQQLICLIQDNKQSFHNQILSTIKSSQSMEKRKRKHTRNVRFYHILREGLTERELHWSSWVPHPPMPPGDTCPRSTAKLMYYLVYLALPTAVFYCALAHMYSEHLCRNKVNLLSHNRGSGGWASSWHSHGELDSRRVLSGGGWAVSWA
jgi:hypothetical protein